MPPWMRRITSTATGVLSMRVEPLLAMRPASLPCLWASRMLLVVKCICVAIETFGAHIGGFICLNTLLRLVNVVKAVSACHAIQHEVHVRGDPDRRCSIIMSGLKYCRGMGLCFVAALP